MARGINKVILLGHLGRDPEVKYMSNGNAVATMTIATSEHWKDRNSGQPQERTEWHRLVIFGKLADIAGQYLRKGSLIYIEGQLQTRKWTDSTGQDRYTTEIVVNTLQMLDRKGAAFGENGDYETNQDLPKTQTPKAIAAEQKALTSHDMNALMNEDFDAPDSDIPL